MLATIVIFIETGEAHCPGEGVNVYEVVPMTAVLMMAGFHVPGTPSFDVNGSAGGSEFLQNGPIGSKLGGPVAPTVKTITFEVSEPVPQ